MIFVLPDLSMLESNIRRNLHALIRIFDRGNARCYKLVSDGTGAQWLKGVGILENVAVPCYEQCKKTDCDVCPKFKNQTCDLLRGHYELKKKEAMDLMKFWAKQRIKQINLATGPTPYSPFTIEEPNIPDDVVGEIFDEEE